MKKILFLKSLIFLALFSCSVDTKKADEQLDLSSNLNRDTISNYLNSIGFFEVTVELEKHMQDSIFIGVTFLNDNDSIDWIEDSPPYFLDIPTNVYIVKLFLFDFYSDLKKYDNVRMYLKFQGNGTDNMQILTDQAGLDDSKKYFENSLFLRNSRATLSYINYEEMMIFRKFMNELIKIVPQYNIENPDYWDCLYGFSNYLVKKEEEHEEYAMIHMDLIWAMNEYLGKEKFDKEFNEKFFSIAKCNGINPENIERSRSAIRQMLKETKPCCYEECFDNELFEK